MKKSGFFILMLVTGYTQATFGGVFSVMDTPQLIHNPIAIRGAVIDSFQFRLIAKNNKTQIFEDTKHLPNFGYTQLCHADQLSEISPKLLNQTCRPLMVSETTTCKDSEGCIGFEIHPSIHDDHEVWLDLLSSVKDPCASVKNAPTPRHWVGFHNPTLEDMDILNCDKSGLPYTKVIINYGEASETITINQ